MSENKKVFFIVNKYSGTGYKDSIEGRILSTCADLSIEPAIEFTQEKGHATELAREAVKSGFQKVFAVGGDGTVNEAAQGLIGSDTALGILPKGSGNGLARHLGIPIRFGSALQLIRSDNVIRMDAGMINNLLSVNVSGIGFDGHVAAHFGKNGKRGLPGYVKIVLREFGGFQEFSGHAIADGEHIDIQSFIVAVANSSQFGNNATIAPFASVCDGVLDLCVIRKPPLMQTIGLIKKVFTGTIGTSPLVTIRKIKTLQLKLKYPVHFHVDGEPHPAAKDFTISVLPGLLNVIVPAGETGSP